MRLKVEWRFSKSCLKSGAIPPDNWGVDELTREFLIESQEGLDRMERCLTELEERPQDGELLAEIFRSVHTIKGTTGFLGYSRLESLSHAGENLLGLLRDRRLQADAEIVSALLDLLDGLRAILASIETEGSEGKGNDRAMIERLIDLQKIGLQNSVRDAVQPPAAIVNAAGPSDEPEQQPSNERRSLHAISKPASAAAGESAVAESNTVKSAAGAADSTLRVDVDLLNRMMNLVGELVLTRNQILQATSADSGFTQLSRRLDMVTADLREAVMKARMQPVSHVFSKFPRLVRDLTQQLGKRVRLELEGQETELDKSLLEAIKDPLTHSVRNAIDHGIEPPAQREAAGKPAEGVLRLRAYQDGSHVVVEVVDDGGGIRVERVRDKAIERRLITAEKAAQMSERELLQLIFLPGFSTATAITNVSGRGVGMDVVRNNVEKIGGKVELESRAGRGTTLRLRIPLTLAIIPALIVRSRGQSFALPQGVLHELVHLTAEHAQEQIEWLEKSPLYRLRGRLLPLVFLGSMLEQKEAAPASGGCYIAVLNADGRRYGLVVDGLADPEEIVVKPLSPVLKQIGLFSGATVMGNGEMALILDPGALASRASIGIRSDEEEEEQTAEPAMEASSTKNEYLLVETGTGQAAVSLADVLRIERIPHRRIERIGPTAVLRFQGSVLPVEDPSGILSRSHEQDEEMTVVVCRDGHRHVGVAVTHVLDVAAGAVLTEAGTEAVAPGVTLLKEKVTRVVDLSRIPPLPPQEPAMALEVAV
ncbi:MAG TPA: chemotaxis protein CheW [Acidobacteriaceae bacterium]|nr:chemotaxis protein CheW [Acidobacteriaceae bacterium]